MDLFRIKKDKSAEILDLEEEKEVDLYTFFGKHDFLDELGYPKLRIDKKIIDKVFSNNRALAIRINGKKARYFAKIDSRGKLCDPDGLYSQRARPGQKSLEFKSISEKAFNFYINFLKTKNKAWLNNAERELIS